MVNNKAIIDITDIEEMKRLLKEEVGFLPSGPGLDRLLSQAEWLRVDAKYVVIEMESYAYGTSTEKRSALSDSDFRAPSSNRSIHS